MALIGSLGGGSQNMVVFSLCASLGALCFGYTIGFSSPAIPSLVSRGILADGDAGWFGSLMTVGALFGGPVCGWCIDKLGRKRSILVSTVPFILGYASMILAQSSMFVFVGRFLTGLGSGMVMVCAPMYIAEIATKSRRGVLGSTVEMNVVIGIFLAFLVGVGQDWKRLAYVGLLPAVLASIAACVLPESPRWLLSQNRKAEALQALRDVRESYVDAEEELMDMEEGIRSMPAVTWSEFLSKAELRRPLVLTLILFFFQQISGVNVVNFYTVTIFRTLIPDKAYVATVILGFVKMTVTIASCMQVDHLGRKILVSVGGSVMAVSMVLFGLCYKLTNSLATGAESSLITWLPVVCLTLATVGFAIGWGPVPMLYMSEVFPAQCRGKAGAMAIFMHWLAAFFVTKEFSTLQLMLGNDGVFYFFGLCCVLGVGFVWNYLPETKGKSLEEIQQFFLHRGTVKL